VRIGVSLSAQHLVPFASYLGEFAREHPGIDLRLQYAPALTMISMVETGELDCVIELDIALTAAPIRRAAAQPDSPYRLRLHYPFLSSSFYAGTVDPDSIGQQLLEQAQRPSGIPAMPVQNAICAPVVRVSGWPALMGCPGVLRSRETSQPVGR
jgi:hypothetical protein